MNTRVMVIIGTAFFSVFFIFMTNGAYKSINDFFIKFDEDGLSWRAIGTRGSRSWDEVVSIQNVDFCNLDFCNLGIKFNKPVESVYVDEFHHMLKGFDLNSCNTEVLKTFVPLFQFTTYQQFSKNKHEQNSIWLTMKEYADRDIPVELK